MRHVPEGTEASEGCKEAPRLDDEHGPREPRPAAGKVRALSDKRDAPGIIGNEEATWQRPFNIEGHVRTAREECPDDTDHHSK